MSNDLVVMVQFASFFYALIFIISVITGVMALNGIRRALEQILDEQEKHTAIFKYYAEKKNAAQKSLH